MNRPRIVKGSNDNIPVRYGLQAWYRYRRGITNASGCSNWADYSGNSRPLLQATAANRPALLSNGELLFNGTTSYMQALFTLVQPATVYILFRQIAYASGAVVFDGGNATFRLVQSGANALTISAGTSLADNTTIPVGAGYGVAACVFNGASSVLQTAGGGPSVTITGNANTNGAGGITLGASNLAGNFSSIGVREVAVYSTAHDATTRLNVLRYLSKIASTVGGVM